MRNANDRFWVPEANLRAAEKFVKKHAKPKFKGHASIYNSYVPTRKEVATLPLPEINQILVDWMSNSVTEIIPSQAQITEVKSILLEREDITDFSELIAMCDCYIRHDS